MQICHLPSLVLFSVSGENATQFLQGQLSNDVHKTTPNTITWHAYCNAKGRVLAMIGLWLHDDKLYGLTHKTLTDLLQKRWRMPLALAKVSLEFHVNLHLLGHISPTNTDSLLHYHGDCYLQLSETNSANQDECAWHYSNIQAGFPMICAQTSNIYIPQYINLDRLGAIDYEKGCYIGQEIIARLHYLGKQKYHLVYEQHPLTPRLMLGETSDLVDLIKYDNVYHALFKRKL